MQIVEIVDGTLTFVVRPEPTVADLRALLRGAFEVAFSIQSPLGGRIVGYRAKDPTGHTRNLAVPGLPRVPVIYGPLIIMAAEDDGRHRSIQYAEEAMFLLRPDGDYALPELTFGPPSTEPPPANPVIEPA